MAPRTLTNAEISTTRTSKLAAPRPVKLRATDLKKLREALLEERDRLIEEIHALDQQAMTDSSSHTESFTQQPGFTMQLADSANEGVQVETALGIRSIEEKQLQQIDEAMRAMAEGQYGTCQRCHEAIAIERLMVKPMARYCVPCLHKIETNRN